MSVNENKYITYPVKLTSEEYDAIKDVIIRYNNVSTLKIDSVHEFIKMAIRFYIRELESTIVKLEMGKEVKKSE